MKPKSSSLIFCFLMLLISACNKNDICVECMMVCKQCKRYNDNLELENQESKCGRPSDVDAWEANRKQYGPYDYVYCSNTSGGDTLEICGSESEVGQEADALLSQGYGCSEDGFADTTAASKKEMLTSKIWNAYKTYDMQGNEQTPANTKIAFSSRNSCAIRNFYGSTGSLTWGLNNNVLSLSYKGNWLILELSFSSLKIREVGGNAEIYFE